MTVDRTGALTADENLLWNRFVALLATAPAALDDRVRAMTGLNHFQYTVLDALAAQPDRRLQLTAVAKAADSSLSRLSHAIDKLENAGLVERATCDHDRRASWAVLTDAGAELVDHTRQNYATLVRDVLIGRVPAAHIAGLTDLLTALLPEATARECETLDAPMTAVS